MLLVYHNEKDETPAMVACLDGCTGAIRFIVLDVASRHAFLFTVTLFLVVFELEMHAICMLVSLALLWRHRIHMLTT